VAYVVVAAVLLASCVSAGLRQVWLDQDPFYRSDVVERVARLVLTERRAPGRCCGREVVPAARRARALVRGDEFFDVPLTRTLVLTRSGRPPDPELPTDLGALANVLRDGDVMVRSAAWMHDAWSAWLKRSIPPLEVWAVRRLLLQRVGDEYVVPSGRDAGVSLRPEGGSLSGGANVPGQWQVSPPASAARDSSARCASRTERRSPPTCIACPR
jgi:hypothetical protein